MTKYEKLLDEIGQSDDIIFLDTMSETTPAQSMRIENDSGIFFNETAFDTTAERFVALAHEKGHCDTASFYSVGTPPMTKEWCEGRAWRRTILDQLPYEKLLAAFDKCKSDDGVNLYEVAERLDVTQEFVEKAIDLCKRMGIKYFFTLVYLNL
ncbi:MAG: hypothetical protein ACRDBM_00020 [Sporomusa sp.]